MRLHSGTKLFLFLFTGFNCISAQTTLHRPFRYYPKEIQNVPQSEKNISGLAKSTGQSWRCVSKTRYEGKYAIVDPKEWDLVQRDTFIYNSDGNLSEHKLSKKQEGWSNGSVFGFDQYIYNNQKQLQSQLDYSCAIGDCSPWQRTDYTYSMSGNACVALYYSFNDSENRWVLLEKDSLVFTRPQTDYDISNDFGHFVAHYAFNPDSTAASGWNCNFYQIKIDSECTANKLVIRGYDQYFNFHYKHIYIFSSPDWKRGNLQESGQQCITLNENCINSKTLRFKDSLGNDTLIIDYVHDNIQTDWNLRETSYCKRSYDSFGNEISVINATFGADTQLNQRETKIIKTYALINNVPANERCVFPATRFSIKRFNGSLQFSAAGINEVTIYNLAGNPVAHDIQKSASKATSLTISCSKIVPGFYMAEVVTGGKKSRCTVTILR